MLDIHGLRDENERLQEFHLPKQITSSTRQTKKNEPLNYHIHSHKMNLFTMENTRKFEEKSRDFIQNKGSTNPFSRDSSYDSIWFIHEKLYTNK